MLELCDYEHEFDTRDTYLGACAMCVLVSWACCRVASEGFHVRYFEHIY